MNTPGYIGSVAAVLTILSFVQQAWRILQTRRTHEISLGMYTLFTCGVACGWLMAYC